ncbi:MAG TPA: hypothetical protein VMT53_05965 [Terriglobales bacterium]|nr:hypothetical protein [Terriglobales bacterium]
MLRLAPAQRAVVMPEVGLLRFGQVALDVAQAAVPRYHTVFSKHQFTQPQLLAIVRLIRYEDWSYREAEVRLANLGTASRSAPPLGSRLHDVVSFPAVTG